MADILFERRDGALIVTLNRPEARNAVTREMNRAMYEALQAVEYDATVRVVLLRGAGDHFMAGGDVKGFNEVLDQSEQERRTQFESRVHAVTPLMLLLERMPQIFVCAVKGACAGMGLSWVAAADLAIAARSAFFVQSQIKIGIIPDGGGTYWPVRAVGLKRAKEIALLGDRFSAEDAERWGLINRVVDDAAFEAAVEDWVKKLSRGPGRAQAVTKQLLNASLSNDYAAQLAQEAVGVSSTAGHPDFAEGVRSFIEKRAPKFGSND
jgi:2-(1,2-epoxy-1,2-dihydrophenyl)acetyl-CoA isomerase